MELVQWAKVLELDEEWVLVVLATEWDRAVVADTAKAEEGLYLLKINCLP